MATRKKTTAAAPKPITGNGAVTKEEVLQLTPKEIAERLRSRFIDAATDLVDRADATAVVQEVVKDLEKEKTAVTLRLLGITKKWGNWEVESPGNHKSLVTDLLDTEAHAVIKSWVNQAVKEVLTEEAKTKFIADAKKAIQSSVRDDLHHRVSSWSMRDAVKPAVNAMLQQAADEVRKELNLPARIEIPTDR